VYHWIDERGKKIKCAAPEYIDSAMTFIQKTLSNETIFPTRLGKHMTHIILSLSLSANHCTENLIIDTRSISE
jgi:hypothetical protein